MRVLAAVVEGGSFVKPADLTGITDSGVSRALSRLDRRLNARLPDRTTWSLTLTHEGQRFYEESPLPSTVPTFNASGGVSC